MKPKPKSNHRANRYQIYRILPYREAILEGVLSSDIIGFQTYDYARHFLSTVESLLDANCSPQVCVGVCCVWPRVRCVFFFLPLRCQRVNLEAFFRRVFFVFVSPSFEEPFFLLLAYIYILRIQEECASCRACGC